ncbi:MAG: glycosyltransferase family 2 protein, partial [Acidimicrobiales bacterium]
SGQSHEFMEEFDAIAREHGFGTFVAEIPPAHSTDGRARRQVSGTLRDSLVMQALHSVHTDYVVCIDADTTTTLPLQVLVQTMHAADLDVASVRLTPANRDTFLSRLQAHEYRMSMRLRRIMPWMVSGGCHVLRTDVHREIMARHSLFFQGNDVELGLIATALRMKVGFIPFEVPTKVPATLRPWLRQRKAWAGGEFRVMVVNLRLSIRHPWLSIYGGVVMFGLLPFRWYFVVHPTMALLAVLGVYMFVNDLANWRHKDLALVAYPFYSLAYSMVILPIGIYTYFKMSFTHHNFGIIRPFRPVHAGEVEPALVGGLLRPGLLSPGLPGRPVSGRPVGVLIGSVGPAVPVGSAMLALGPGSPPRPELVGVG